MSTDPTTAQLILDTGDQALMATAERAAIDDGEACPSPAMPTLPGMQIVDAKGQQIRTRLTAAQDDEERQDKVRRTRDRSVIEAHRSGARVTLPAGEPVPTVIPWALGGIAAVTVVETWALAAPMATILRIEDGSWERFVIPGLIAAGAAVLAHKAAKEAIEAKQASSPAAADGARRKARLAVLVLIVLAIGGLVARSYAAGLEQVNAGGYGIDASGVLVFGIVQVSFVATSLCLASFLHHRRDQARCRAIEAWVDRLERAQPALLGRIEDAPARRANEHRQLDDSVARAHRAYESALVRAHPHTEAAAAWALRFGGGPIPPAAPASDPGPTPTDPRPSPGSTPTDSPVVDLGKPAPSADPDEPRDHDQGLVDAILTPRG